MLAHMTITMVRELCSGKLEDGDVLTSLLSRHWMVMLRLCGT